MEYPHVTAILVAYNSEAVIGRSLEPLANSPLVTAITVVDNCSVDDTCDMVRRDFPSSTVIENPRNEGFGRANNTALGKVKTPYALLINPDAILETAALEKLLAAAMRYPDAAIIAPTLYDEDGKEHRSYKRDVFARENSRDIYTPPEDDLCAEFLSGAVWLVNMKHWRTVGFFDPHIFLYYEDDDMCIRLRKAGYGLVLVPEAKAIHLMGASSGKVNLEVDFFRQKHLIYSRLYLEEKHKGAAAAKKLGRKLNFEYACKISWYRLRFDRKKINRYRGRLRAIFEFSERPKSAKAA